MAILVNGTIEGYAKLIATTRPVFNVPSNSHVVGTSWVSHQLTRQLVHLEKCNPVILIGCSLHNCLLEN